MFGISTALLTPFEENGAIDLARLGAHARTLMTEGADGVTLYGTTGEGASIAMDEREAGIDALLSAGIPASKIVLGVCANSLGDAARQVAQGRDRGVSDFLLLPPFYFKGNSDDGLFAWHSELFARTDAEARYILYHIPQVSGVGLSAGLVGRLVGSAGKRIRAIKDSSGNWDTARSFLDLGSLTVLVGDERLLHRAMALGAGGAITGMANLYPARMKRIVETATEDTALSEEVTRVVSVPVVAALKTLISARTGDKGWNRLRPPLAPLDAAARATLLPADVSAA
ncbi:dihydrodipicolinate synthase family protein [Silicimonas algicola]|uniref:4-hydroxy-tetrahydrodipicolinate synthase n=1 Tax=Silicimonas algicola TaxID=1826607 RepID=A0A316GGI0_9RHOB|nr:dihydrodipicolinate synthase family protein [Silicimonas algicola]AZQ66673.1 dihydrodipicolinate synthase family protein [Silicimonas algicola]PWK59026.1 4-hydroxy-tetrahydrodipicolinate synthase [Silicimonas algicola]